jgi:8-oxo-dGTP diphosphatase
MMRYVNGFLINPRTTEVLFIQKNRPLFQKGKWNGIGGKIEPDEEPIHAMVREFLEETDIVTQPEDWTHTVTLTGAEFEVIFYRQFVTGMPPFKQVTDEVVGIFHLADVFQALPVLDNMRIILPIQFATTIQLPLQFISIPKH